MINVTDLHKEFISLGKPSYALNLAFGKRKKETVKAVDGISFTANDGAILGLLGANGAGKTTSLRMVASLLAPDEGAIMVDDVVVTPGLQASQGRMNIVGCKRLVPTIYRA